MAQNPGVFNETLLSKLESFQAQLGTRVLKLTKFTANNIPFMALHWPSMKCHCLCAKLSFLYRICCEGEGSLRDQVFTSLAASDVESICLIKQYRFLEHPYGSNFTDEILNNSGVSLRSLKERVVKVDYLHLISQAKVHPSQRHVLEVSTNIGWLRIWDNALDYGPSGTISSLSVLKLLCKTVFVDRACPVENYDCCSTRLCAM